MANNKYTKFTSLEEQNVVNDVAPASSLTGRERLHWHWIVSTTFKRINLLKYMANPKHKNHCHCVPPNFIEK